jgi:heptosyltransferase-1
VLVVKLSSLGDVIQTLPVLHDIHSRYPDCSIDWVVEEAFADLLATVPSIRKVIPIAQRRWRKTFWQADTRAAWRAFWHELQTDTYDVVMDFQGLIKSARVARMARLNPGGFSVTYANASDWCAYEWPVRWLSQRSVPMEKTIHAVARYRSLAARALAQDAAQWLAQAPVYPWPAVPAVQPRLAVLAFGTTRADNLWPTEHWLGLGRQLIAQGFALALPQSSGQEQAWADQLAQNLGAACQVWPRMSLAELTSRMAAATLVVGVDSGLSHLAIALNLPVVQIFSQPRVARAGPLGRAHQQPVGGEHAPHTDEVWQTCQQVLAAAPARHSV